MPALIHTQKAECEPFKADTGLLARSRSALQAAELEIISWSPSELTGQEVSPALQREADFEYEKVPLSPWSRPHG